MAITREICYPNRTMITRSMMRHMIALLLAEEAREEEEYCREFCRCGWRWTIDRSGDKTCQNCVYRPDGD